MNPWIETRFIENGLKMVYLGLKTVNAINDDHFKKSGDLVKIITTKTLIRFFKNFLGQICTNQI